MMTISKPLTAGSVSRYFTEEYASPGNSYFSEEGKTPGVWAGELAGDLGLSGPVTAEAFARLAEGQDPQTGEQLIKHRDTIKTEAGLEVGHRAGWDLTISAPKTVSLTALVGGDARVREAHRSAVRDALSEAEKYIQARMGGLQPPQTTGKMIAATFEHDTARPAGGYPAPQLHTHVVVFNMTQDRDTGQARSLQPHELFRIQSLVTAVYQNRLEHDLRRLGYRIERGANHAPEIAGYTAEYRAAESLRSQQINALMEAKGLTGQESRSIAAHQNREQKLQLTPAELRALHQEHAAQFGNQPARVVLEAAARHVRGITPEKVEERAHTALNFARNRLSERNAVFEHFEVVRDALRHTQGRAGPEDIYRELAKQKEQGRFIPVEHIRPGAPMYRYTTPELVQTERETIQLVLAGRNQQRPMAVTEAAIHLRYAALNEDQRRLIYDALTTRDQIFGIQGRAGTGKTTALTAIREVAEEYGYTTRGLGPTSRAAKGLSEAGMQSETLQSYLTRGYEPADEARPRLFFVDESSLTSGRQMRDFLVTMGPHDRALLVGDTRQHQSVEAGRIFAELQDAGMKTASLNTIVRQKDEGLRTVVEAMASGQIGRGVDLLGGQGRIRSIEHRQERFAAIAKAYAAQPDGTLVISPDNRSRQELNTAIRAELRVSGKLKADVYTVPVLVNRQDLTGEDRGRAGSYRAGDLVRYLKGSKTLGLEAKSYATVVFSDPESNRITVRKTDGKTVTYDPARLKGVTVYQPETRSFAEGERVQFTAPWRDKAISNRETGTISAIDDKGNMRVKLDGSGRTVGWNLRENRHVEYAYAMTSHSSQGATVDRVLVHVDTGDSRNRALINQTLGYVALSRPRHEAQIFTDNAANLG